MDRRERMRLYMAHVAAVRRARGLCYRCGGPRSDDHKACRHCRLKRMDAHPQNALNRLDSGRSTGACST